MTPTKLLIGQLLSGLRHHGARRLGGDATRCCWLKGMLSTSTRDVPRDSLPLGRVAVAYVQAAQRLKTAAHVQACLNTRLTIRHPYNRDTCREYAGYQRGSLLLP